MNWNPTENKDAAAMAFWFDKAAEEIHAWAVGKGWWEDPDRNILEQCALFHSEISEAVEALRENADPAVGHYREDGKPEGFGPELVDCIIRILDTCHRYRIPIGALLVEKMAFNETRPYRHGGKSA